MNLSEWQKQGFSSTLAGDLQTGPKRMSKNLVKTASSIPVSRRKVQGDPGAATGICGTEFQTPSPGKARVSTVEDRNLKVNRYHMVDERSSLLGTASFWGWGEFALECSWPKQVS